MRKLMIFACLLALMVPAVALAAEHHGAWFDEAIFTSEADQAKVLAMMKSGDAQFFGNAFDTTQLAAIAAAGFPYEVSYGLYFGYLINIADFNNGVYNPFANQKICVALNNLIDRDYLVDEYLNGLGMPRITTVDKNGPVYAEIAATARGVEVMALYNEEKAIAQIEEGLTEDGAVKKDGKWYYNDEPVTVIGIIRVEDERTELGDYLADKLEKVGITVDRQYKTSPEASPIWLTSDPHDGKWNYYTEGWIATAIDREQSSDHAFFYTDLVWPAPFTRAMPEKLDPDVYEACRSLMITDYKTLEERRALLAKAEIGTYESGFHIWAVTTAGPWVIPQGTDVTFDVFAGIFGSPWWSRTMRYVDEDGAPIAGGTMNIVSPSLFVEPWNAIRGSNWLYDSEIYTGTEDPVFLTDPFTGLAVPNWVESADVVAKEGLIPIRVTHTDWCHLSYATEIEVPGDAWSDWNATTQTFITAAQRFPDGAKAECKLTVHFPADLYSRKWHDGSNFSLADCIMAFIMNFDRAKPESAIYDESEVPKVAEPVADESNLA